MSSLSWRLQQVVMDQGQEGRVSIVVWGVFHSLEANTERMRKSNFFPQPGEHLELELFWSCHTTPPTSTELAQLALGFFAQHNLQMHNNCTPIIKQSWLISFSQHIYHCINIQYYLIYCIHMPCFHRLLEQFTYRPPEGNLTRHFLCHCCIFLPCAFVHVLCLHVFLIPFLCTSVPHDPLIKLVALASPYCPYIYLLFCVSHCCLCFLLPVSFCSRLLWCCPVITISFCILSRSE